MISQTAQIIQKLIVPNCKQLSQTSLQNLNILIQQARAQMSVRQFEAHLEQWKILAKKLNNNDKLTYLKQSNCRILLIALIRQDAMGIFNCSYLNRAKIDNQYIRYLKQLGPYFFIEVVMIVSKLKTIHKHFYKNLCGKMLQNHISIKILRILELCNQKKRSINNNKAKFLCIVQDQNDRLQITKQLGKMLRQAWKKDKNKETPKEQQPQNNFELQDWQQTPVKQMVKPFQKWNNDNYQNQFSASFNFEPPICRYPSNQSLDFLLQ